jgi:hypothetical protein
MEDPGPWDGALRAWVRAFERAPGQPATGSVLPNEGCRITGGLVSHGKLELCPVVLWAGAALLTASRDSANVNDFALVAMLGLLGLKTF